MADRFCKSCGVKVNGDLSNCPLCGKYLLKDGEHASLTKTSYPIYSFSAVSREKAVKILKNVMIFAIILCTLINLIFLTKPFWFPLAIVPIFCLYMIFVHPFKHGGNLLNNMTQEAIYASIMLIFIDAYLHYNFFKPFGWSFGYVVPFMWVLVIVTLFIVSLASKNFAKNITRTMPIILVTSVIYLLVKIIAFKILATWPSVIFVCVAAGWWLLAFSFRKKIVAGEMKKDYHVN